MVDDIAYVCLVDAHTECDRGYDDVALVIHPSLLDPLLLLIFDISVVIGCLMPSFRQFETDLLAFFLAETVYQSCLILVSLDDLLYLL